MRFKLVSVINTVCSYTIHYSITFHCCLLIRHSKLRLRFGNFWTLCVIQLSKTKKLKRKVEYLDQSLEGRSKEQDDSSEQGDLLETQGDRGSLETNQDVSEKEELERLVQSS